MTEIREPAHLNPKSDKGTGPLYQRSPRQPLRTHNLGHAVMLSNIRTFSLVALFTCCLLGLAAYLTFHLWQLDKDRAHAVLDPGAMERAILIQNRAEALVAADKYDEAIGMGDKAAAEQALDTYLRLRPHDAQALKERAYLYAYRGAYDEALATLRRAMITSPDWVPLYVDAAATAAVLGWISDALHYLDQAAALTSPTAVYRIYRKPAFRDVRRTEAGRTFEWTLAERAGEMPDDAEPMVTSP